MAAQDHPEQIAEEFESQWVKVEGLPIHARVRVDRAPADAPAVVLVHGRSWFRQFVRWRQNVNPRPIGEIAKRDYRACGILRLLRTFQYSIRHQPEECLPKIDAPVLVVRGSNDPICRPA